MANTFILFISQLLYEHQTRYNLQSVSNHFILGTSNGSLVVGKVPDTTTTTAQTPHILLTSGHQCHLQGILSLLTKLLLICHSATWHTFHLQHSSTRQTLRHSVLNKMESDKRLQTS